MKPARSRHCIRGVNYDPCHWLIEVSWEGCNDVDSEARRPAYSDSTDIPTGDGEVLEIATLTCTYGAFFNLPRLEKALFNYV